MMKKLLATFATLAAFAGAVQAESISVAATAVPHAEILEFVKPALAKQGVELQIKVFTDYVQPNVQVAEGRLDANFFQHQPYLDEFNNSRGTQLVSIAGVHVEPFGAYSSKVKNLADLPQGANVVIPNDATNGGRALLLLQKAGVIKLKDGAGITATVKDIAENPKAIKVRELEAATLPRVLGQVDLALINTNYALEAKLGVQPQHFFFQRVADGVRLCLGFAGEFIIVVHGFNHAHDFVLAHFVFLLLDCNLFGGYLYQLSI